ncbi:MAG: hypothetical protein V4721_00515 [Bacteroidota bacterium]
METTFKIGMTLPAVAYTDSAVQSAAVSLTTTKVRIWCSTDCFIKIGSNPTASATDGMPMSGGLPEFFDIRPGERISMIRQTVSGNGYITQMSKN